MTITPFSNFYVSSYTCADDDLHRAESNPNLVLAAGNISCYAADAYIGNASNTPAIIRANAVIWFDSPFRPFDIMFKNLVAGANTQIVIYGPVQEK